VGGRGSSTTVNNGYSSFSQLKNTLSKKYGITNPDDFSDVDIKALSETMQGFEDVLKDFGAEEVFQGLYVDENTREDGSYGFGNLSLSKKKLRNYNRGDKELKQEHANRWSSTDSFKGLGAHEGAHAVEYYLTRKSKAFKTDKERNLAAAKNKIANDIVNEAVRRIKKTPYGKGKSTNELLSSISLYAGEKKVEAFAEGIANYKIKGKKGNPLGREIYNVTKKYLKG